MRTTVTLDPDVERYIKEACRTQEKSFKHVINEALRASLKPKEATPELLPPRSMGLQPGVDPRRLSELADELEAEATIAAEGKSRYSKS